MHSPWNCFLTILVFVQETVLTAQSRGTGESVLVTVTLIREKSFGDPECVQFFNVLFNKMMKVLKYVRMKQSYFDPNRVSFWASAIKWASFGVIGKLFLSVLHFPIKIETILLRCQLVQFCFEHLQGKSSRGGLEVEQWYDNRTLSISVDQSPLGACMIIWYQWTRYVMYILDVCYMCV